MTLRVRVLPGVVLLSVVLGGCAAVGLDDSLVEDGTIQDVAPAALASRLLKPGSGDWINFGIAYLIHDPLAPNWEIQETRVSEDVFHMQLRMKRYHKGGEGESMLILKRRAAQLQRELGYGSYRILDYMEGIDSQTLGARRFGEGSIQLVWR